MSWELICVASCASCWHVRVVIKNVRQRLWMCINKTSRLSLCESICFCIGLLFSACEPIHSLLYTIVNNVSIYNSWFCIDWTGRKWFQPIACFQIGFCVQYLVKQKRVMSSLETSLNDCISIFSYWFWQATSCNQQHSKCK